MFLEREKEVLQFVKALKRLQNSGFSSKEIFDVVQDSLGSKDFTLPLSIFNHKVLGALESIVVYLREHNKLDYKKIGNLLSRSAVAVGNTYRAARKKFSGSLSVKAEITIPVSLFEDRTVSVQRKLVRYLHDERHLNFSEIARFLARDPRTIWTAYHAGGSQ